MKFKLLLSLLCAGALTAGAQGQGFKDGIEYYKADQYGNAKTILERTLNDGTTDQSLAYYYLGQIAVHDKDMSAAKSYFDKGVAANPDNGFNYVGLGTIDLKNGDPKAAKDQFDMAKSKGKKNAAILTAIARAYYNADPVAYAKEVEKFLSNAYKADKLSPAVFIMRGDMDLDRNDVGSAAANYENAIYNDPTSAEAYVKYANAYIKVNPDYAINKLKELNQKVPNSALAQRELAEKYYDNEQLTMAAQQYGDYIKNPNHFKEDEERYAQLLFFGQKYDESYDLASAILAMDPSASRMKRLLFLNRAAQERNDEALAQAQEFFAMDVTKDNNRFTANDYTTYGELLHKLGQDSLSVIQYEKAVETNPDKADLLKALSSAYSSAKNYNGALEAFQKFIDKGDYVTNDLVTLASRYQNVAATAEPGSETKANAIGKAIETINKVIERVPDNFIPVRNKARMMLVKHDNEPSEEMVAEYQKVLTMLDSDPANLQKRVDTYKEAYSQIASYYITARDNETAKTYYLKLLEMDPTNEALREYIENLK